MVSQYNEFVREYAKKCRKQGKKFELANAAKAWRGIRGGDWRSFLGIKPKSPVYTSAQAAVQKPVESRFAALGRQQIAQMSAIQRALRNQQHQQQLQQAGYAHPQHEIVHRPGGGTDIRSYSPPKTDIVHRPGSGPIRI